LEHLVAQAQTHQLVVHQFNMLVVVVVVVIAVLLVDLAWLAVAMAVALLRHLQQA
jgi:hypothetical protein